MQRHGFAHVGPPERPTNHPQGRFGDGLDHEEVPLWMRYNTFASGSSRMNSPTTNTKAQSAAESLRGHLFGPILPTISNMNVPQQNPYMPGNPRQRPVDVFQPAWSTADHVNHHTHQQSAMLHHDQFNQYSPWSNGSDFPIAGAATHALNQPIGHGEFGPPVVRPDTYNSIFTHQQMPIAPRHHSDYYGNQPTFDPNLVQHYHSAQGSGHGQVHDQYSKPVLHALPVLVHL